jgi:hypothetical protein
MVPASKSLLEAESRAAFRGVVIMIVSNASFLVT